MGSSAPGLCSTGSTAAAAQQHVGSSQIGDQTCVSCVGREILYHWATRGALHKGFLIFSNLLSRLLFHLLCTSMWTTFCNNSLKLFVLWGLLSRKTMEIYSVPTNTYLFLGSPLCYSTFICESKVLLNFLGRWWWRFGKIIADNIRGALHTSLGLC